VRRAFAIILIQCIAIFGGCLATHPTWETADFLSPLEPVPIAVNESDPQLAAAESAYAEARDLELEDNEACVEAYLEAAQLLWPIFSDNCHVDEFEERREARLYQSTVAKLIVTAQRFQRFDSVRGIRLGSINQGNIRWLPIRYHGFSWHPEEFQRFQTVGNYRPPDTIDPKRQSGLGIPLLGQLSSERNLSSPRQTLRQRPCCVRLNRPRPVHRSVRSCSISSTR
jgi:hypothetical protein